jgi:hypothetical protein
MKKIIKILNEYDNEFDYVNSLSQAQMEKSKERLQNIANKKLEAKNNNGNITVGGKPMTFTDYIVTYNVTQKELADADALNKKTEQDRVNQQQRFTNIVNIVKSVDNDGIIRNPNSKLNNTPFQDYVKKYSITSKEIQDARNYVATAQPNKTTEPTKPTPSVATPPKQSPTQTTKVKTPSVQELQSLLTKLSMNVNEDIQRIKYLLNYQKGRVITEQTAQPDPQEPAGLQDPKTLITKIQTILRDKKYNLGPRGVDGQWGTYTKNALQQELSKIENKKTTNTQPTEEPKPRETATVTTNVAEPGKLNVSAPKINPTLPAQAQMPTTTPEQYYNTLVSGGYIDNSNENRIVYRGQKITPEVENAVTNYLTGLGYTKTRERSPENKDKQVVVWKK